MNFAVFSRSDPHSRQIARNIVYRLQESNWCENSSFPEIVICVGGDGTILRAIHNYIDQLENIKFIGIHTGTLGFLTDYTSDELSIFLNDILENEHRVEAAPLLQLQSDGLYKTLYALNDFRIGSWSESVVFNIYIDGEFFETTMGSGICISTQAGSSAANRTLGGGVVDSGIQMIELTEIMPMIHKGHHSLRNPYIMKSNRVLTIEPVRGLRDLRVSYDHKTLNGRNCNHFKVQYSDKKVYFLRLRPYSYLQRLKNIY